MKGDHNDADLLSISKLFQNISESKISRKVMKTKDSSTLVEISHVLQENTLDENGKATTTETEYLTPCCDCGKPLTTDNIHQCASCDAFGCDCILEYKCFHCKEITCRNCRDSMTEGIHICNQCANEIRKGNIKKMIFQFIKDLLLSIFFVKDEN